MCCLLLLFTDSDYPFGIFNLFLQIRNHIGNNACTEINIWSKIRIAIHQIYIELYCSADGRQRFCNHLTNYYPLACPVCVAHLFIFLFVPLLVFTFLVPCWNVRYNFHIKTMFGSSLPPVVCIRTRVLRYLFAHSGVKHILCCVVCFICLCLVSCAKCCQFLWIVYSRLSLRFSLTFI